MLLRQVLEELEKNQSVMSVTDLSRKLKIRQQLLVTMLDFWVRQGRLQASYQLNECASECLSKSCANCAFRPQIPLAYSLNTGEK